MYNLKSRIIRHRLITHTYCIYHFAGTLRDWWNEETAEQFTERAQCVVDQFGNFTSKQVGLSLNGINTQGENIADMGGLLPAYEGYGKINVV